MSVQPLFYRFYLRGKYPRYLWETRLSKLQHGCCDKDSGMIVINIPKMLEYRRMLGKLLLGLTSVQNET